MCQLIVKELLEPVDSNQTQIMICTMVHSSGVCQSESFFDEKIKPWETLEKVSQS